jgi:hypothetical protein
MRWRSSSVARSAPSEKFWRRRTALTSRIEQITEELLDLRVGSPDGTVGGNDEDAIRSRVEDRLIFIYR